MSVRMQGAGCRVQGAGVYGCRVKVLGLMSVESLGSSRRDGGGSRVV